MPDQVGNPQGVGGYSKRPAGHDALDVPAQAGDRRRDPRPVQPEQLDAGHLLPVVALPRLAVQLPDRQAFEQQLRVHQACVHPQQELGVPGVIGETGDLVDPVDVVVHQVDAPRGFERFLPRAERDLVGELERPLQPLPRIALVEAGLPGSRQHQGVGRLHEKGPGPSEQHRGLPVDLPRGRTRPERVPRRRTHTEVHSTKRSPDRKAPGIARGCRPGNGPARYAGRMNRPSLYVTGSNGPT